MSPRTGAQSSPGSSPVSNPLSSQLLSEIKQRRPFASPAEEAAVGLLRTSDELRRRISEVIEGEGITHQQYNVLRILRGSHPEPLPTLEIAARMIETAPGITRLLDRLEAKGHVTRRRCDTDRRQVHCTITDRGLGLLGRLDRPLLEDLARLFEPIGEAGAISLSGLLDGVRSGIRAASGRQDGGPPDGNASRS